METVKMTDLNLGDHVRLENMADWNHAIVKQITDDSIHFFRPYGVTADFSYTGGVMCYTGVEEWSAPKNDATVTRTRRGSLILDTHDLVPRKPIAA